jgi:hypothetical protein
VVRIELDEAIRRSDRRRALAALPVRVRDVELRLLRVAAIGIARLELLEVLDRFFPVPRIHLVLRFAVQALRGPADGFVLLADR